MASVERAMAKAAAALLPGLLPTPPRSTVAPCLIILPSSFASKPKPGRADSVERWDAHKKPGSPASSCGSSSPCRASSGERWDINKKIPGSSSSPSSSSQGSSRASSPSSSSRGSSSTVCDQWDSSKRSPSRASTERWDINKKISRSSTSSSSSSQGSSRTSSSSSSSTRRGCEKWDISKRPPSRASSTDRWDTHKKARSAVLADAQSQTAEQEERNISDKQPRMDHVFSGSSFFASPDPSMLPMPIFFGSKLVPGMIPVPAR